MPFLETTDAQVRACQDCAARLANGESTALTNFTVSRWPLVLLCEHEVEVEMQAARDETERERAEKAEAERDEARGLVDGASDEATQLAYRFVAMQTERDSWRERAEASERDRERLVEEQFWMREEREVLRSAAESVLHDWGRDRRIGDSFAMNAIRDALAAARAPSTPMQENPND